MFYFAFFKITNPGYSIIYPSTMIPFPGDSIIVVSGRKNITETYERPIQPKRRSPKLTTTISPSNKTSSKSTISGNKPAENEIPSVENS
jgi:hypothetical protein